MEIVKNCIQVKNYVTKSNLPTCDFVINPYVGCPHGCVYCYASFMKRFTGHQEPWGSFIDIKYCNTPINIKKLQGKSVFLSSVTDCYNAFEEEYQITRSILKQLTDVDCEIGISTKSKLILRDLDLLTQCKNLKVSISINTLDESFRKDMDHASCIQERLETLKSLHQAGIYTILFMSPIFPYITDFKEIIEVSKEYIDEYWFENLNLRGSYKQDILNYIKEKYPQYIEEYDRIYKYKDLQYWEELAIDIDNYCQNKKVHYTNYFYHEKLVKEKLEKQRKKDSQSNDC